MLLFREEITTIDSLQDPILISFKNILVFFPPSHLVMPFIDQHCHLFINFFSRWGNKGEGGHFLFSVLLKYAFMMNSAQRHGFNGKYTHGESVKVSHRRTQIMLYYFIA